MLTAPTGVGPLAVSTTIMAKHVPEVVRAFREGGGVPYAAFGPEWTDAWDAVGRGVYDTMLVDEYLPLAPGLGDLLTQGARVADVACGTGHALIVLARAFPALDVHRLRPRRARDRQGPGRGRGRRAGERDLRGGRRCPAAGDVALRRDLRLRRDSRSGGTGRGADPRSRRRWCPAGCCSCASRTRRTRSPGTWPTPWRRSCTRSARCTA